MLEPGAGRSTDVALGVLRTAALRRARAVSPARISRAAVKGVGALAAATILAPMAQQDAELVERVLDGDRVAFEALMAAHLERVRAIAGSLLGNDPQVDDVVQETFLHAYRRLGQLHEPASFPSWLARIARNEAVNLLRRKQRQRRTGAVSLAAVAEQPAEDHQEEEQQQAERLKMLDAALADLQPSYREIIALKYDADLSYEQIAETLATSVANVEKRLYRARQKLLQLMGESIEPSRRSEP